MTRKAANNSDQIAESRKEGEGWRHRDRLPFLIVVGFLKAQ